MYAEGFPFLSPQPAMILVGAAFTKGWKGAIWVSFSLKHLDASGSLAPYKCTNSLTHSSGLWNIHYHHWGQLGQVLTNSTTAVFYLNKHRGAGSPQLCQEEITLWNFYIKNNILLKDFHLPGMRSTVADSVSGNSASYHDEWPVKRDILQPIFHQQ